MGQPRDDGNPYVPIHQMPRPKGVARSAFGLQADSRRTSNPMHTFGVTDRDQAAKCFISSDHTAVDQKGKALSVLGVYKLPAALDKQPEALKRSAPSYSFSQLDRFVGTPSPTSVPGPGTYISPSAFGTQADSLKETEPHYKMTQADRGQYKKEFISERMMSGMLGTIGPDPGTYPVQSALGKQAPSGKRTAPSYTLPQVSRLQNEFERLSKSLPPPGQYETWLSIGRQAQSQWKTQPSTTWSKMSSWDNEKARFLSLNHARQLLGSASPANYDHQNGVNTSSFGKQALSSRTSPQRASFGSAPRMVFKATATPGPGAYDD